MKADSTRPCSGRSNLRSARSRRIPGQGARSVDRPGRRRVHPAPRGLPRTAVRTPCSWPIHQELLRKLVAAGARRTTRRSPLTGRSYFPPAARFRVVESGPPFAPCFFPPWCRFWRAAGGVTLLSGCASCQSTSASCRAGSGAGSATRVEATRPPTPYLADRTNDKVQANDISTSSSIRRLERRWRRAEWAGRGARAASPYAGLSSGTWR